MTPAEFKLTEPPRKSMQIETQIQIAIVSGLRLLLPPEVVLFSIWNGGKASKREAALRKAMGARAGMPDLCCLFAGRPHFIEVKRPAVKGHHPAGRQSEPQLWFAAWCIENGYQIAVVHSLGEALAALRRFGVPLRGRIAA
jgi:hypothetical protein